MAGFIGSPGPFDHRTHKWSSYQTQFEHFLRVNEITEESRKTSCIIALIGAETYETLESLTFPDKPERFKSEDLFKMLTSHFEPKRLKIAEQYHFWRNTQGPSQSLADYISSLRKMASTCQFPGEYLQHALCTAFVLGLHDESIACKLLSEKDTTLDKAISIAQNMEAAGKKQTRSQCQLQHKNLFHRDPVHPVMQKTTGDLLVHIVILSAHAANAWVTLQECVGIDTNSKQGDLSSLVLPNIELMLSTRPRNPNTVQMSLLLAQTFRANRF